MQSAYQFGDGDLASRRLALLAEVFEPTTADLLRTAAPPSPALAVDLGCGPGHTTALLARTLRPRRLLGVDASETFLTEARLRVPEARFERRDLLTEPPCAEPAALLFARYLLSHLPEPARALSLWSASLVCGGVLAVEELEAIEPGQEDFAEYLSVVEAMLADQGSTLYVGPALAALPDPPGTVRSLDRPRRFPVDARQASRMFQMNIPNWRDRPFIRERFGDARIDRLAAALRRIEERGAANAPQWTLRQIAWQKL